jgi:peptide/nickel transport system permease protein
MEKSRIKENNSQIEIDIKALKQHRREQISLTFKRFFRNRLATVGGTIVFLLIIIAIFAPFLAPYNPNEMDSANTIAPLSWSHPLGTDEFGRDTLSRLIYGARISIQVGAISVLISSIVGTLIGAFAGFYGGWLDNVLMRIMDAIFSLPAILLAIALVAVLGPNIVNAMIAIGIIYTPIFARVVRSSVIANKESEYVEAGRALGQSNIRILFEHVLPNSASPIIVQATVTFAEAIIIEAGLSFIGLGVPPPDPSWGTMLTEARGYMDSHPLVAIFPGVAISLSVLGFNLLGDGLRDLFDPRLRRFTM